MIAQQKHRLLHATSTASSVFSNEQRPIPRLCRSLFVQYLVFAVVSFVLVRFSTYALSPPEVPLIFPILVRGAVLMRMVTGEEGLQGITHIICDEIHERCVGKLCQSTLQC